MILLGTITIIALIFTLNKTISLFLIYVMGMAGSLGLVIYFTAHRWNKKKVSIQNEYRK